MQLKLGVTMNQDTMNVARTGRGIIQWHPGWLAATIGGTSWLAFGAVVLGWQGNYFGSAISAAWCVVTGLAC